MLQTFQVFFGAFTVIVGVDLAQFFQVSADLVIVTRVVLVSSIVAVVVTG